MTAETPLSKNEQSRRGRVDIFERIGFIFIIAISGVVLLLGGLAVFGVSPSSSFTLERALAANYEPPLTPCSIGVARTNSRWCAERGNERQARDCQDLAQSSGLRRESSPFPSSPIGPLLGAISPIAASSIWSVVVSNNRHYSKHEYKQCEC